MANAVGILIAVLAFGSIASSQTGKNIPLTDAQKMDIVRVHNDFRRSRYSSNMRYMTWDGELEWMAESYGKLCRFRHSKNRMHSKYPSVGENIYASKIKVEKFKVGTPLRKWYSENSDFNYYSSTCQKGKVCNHYTQVVWADTSKIGCSITECKYITEVKYRNAPLFICLYATAGNVIKGPNKVLEKVYERGLPCSKCSDDEDYCRNRLCANSERDFLAPQDHFKRESAATAYIVAIAVLSALVLVLIALILCREFYPRRFSTRCCGKERLKKVSRSATHGTSMTSSLSFTKANTAGDENSKPLIEKTPSQLEVNAECSGAGTPITTVSRRPPSLDLQQKRDSRTSLPKPSHPAPKSPPPKIPAPVLVRR